MDIKDYDMLLNIIEENIQRPWNEVELIIRNELCELPRVIGDFRKRISGDGMTMIQYFKERKMLRTLADASTRRLTSQEGLEEIAYEYGYETYSTFYRTVRLKFNKAPIDLLKTGHVECPEPNYLESVMNNTEEGRQMAESEMLAQRENEIEILKALNVEQIDRIKSLQDEISARNRADRLAKKDDYDKTHPEVRCKIIGDQDSKTMFFSEGAKALYRKVTDLENYREIYGLSVDQIISAYNTSIINQISLDKAAYELAMMLEAQEYESIFGEDDCDWEEEWNEYQLYEMNSAEAWSEYYADGETDAYEGYGDVDRYSDDICF